MLALSAAALVVFLVAVFQLDPIVRWLWPIPVAMFFVYPYLKRFTWLSHLWLGACLGLAPVGAWLAVSGAAPWEAWALGGAVLLWVAGFDLFYSLYDLEHDRTRRAAFVGGALRRAGRLLGARASSTRARSPCSRSPGSGSSRGLVLAGVVAVAGLLAYEHRSSGPAISAA